MSELIDRDELIKKIKPHAEYEYERTRKQAFCQILDYIESAKVISVDCDKNTRLLDAKEIIRIAESEFSEDDMFKIRWLISHTPTSPILDNIVEKLEEKTEFLKDCTKYGNESAEQQEKSYSTMMMYEVSDLVDDLIDIVKQEINNGLE